MRTLKATLCVILCCVSVRTTGQETDGYLQLVRRFAGGDLDGAARELAAWVPTRERLAVEALIADIRRREQAAGRATDWQPNERKAVEAAAMLETALALRAFRRRETDSSKFHFGEARTLMDAIPARVLEPFARRWFLVIGTTFITWGELGEAETILGAGLHRFPLNAQLRLASGIVAEADAMLGPSTVTSQPQARRRPRAAFLLDAENEFRKALDIDSAFVEARVRLGRVLSLKGDRAAARTELTRAITEAKTSNIVYLAHLFLGRILVDDGDLTNGQREYQAALAVRPQWPTPHIALSELADRLGQIDKAREYVAALTAPNMTDSEDVLDPWWTYLLGGGGQLQPAARWLSEAIRP
jgi:tetratricopeptide (TPR) repeat protein